MPAAGGAAAAAGSGPQDRPDPGPVPAGAETSATGILPGGGTPAAAPGGPPRGSGIGRAAVLIAALTVAARLLGLVRQVVFAHTVGSACLGTAYVTANQVPNIIYDIVLGGALTAIMVPVLARPARQSADSQAAAGEVAATSSALITWTILILVPVSVAIALAAGPIASLLNPANPAVACSHASVVSVTGQMLAVFAPQVPLYGLAVVLYGILQAHRRFAAPAIAPVLSSLVVIAAYLVFVPFGRAYRQHLTGLPASAELILSAGTTLGVAALAVTPLIPLLRLRLRLRPALHFPAGVGRRAAGLAGYGIAALVAQDIALLVVIRLANGSAAGGAIVLYNYGWQVFVSVYAVLAIPIAVSAFPVLSATEGAEFDETAAGSARAVLLLSCLGAALMAAVAEPAARLFESGAQVPVLAWGFAAFAPGVIGYGVIACLSRVLLARRRTTTAAVLVAGGWAVTIIADIVLVHLAPARWAVGALGLGNTLGMTAGAVALAVAVRRTCGGRALRGTTRAAVAGVVAAAAGAAAGAGAARLLPSPAVAAAVAAGVLAAACAAAVAGALAFLLDGGELKAALGRIRRTAPR
ncbi:MAG TPA: lipid II flippase MurJ [Streptosporangiaceae bacterium]